MSKTITNPSFIDYETEELNRLGIDLGERMSGIIPAPYNCRSENV